MRRAGRISKAAGAKFAQQILAGDELACPDLGQRLDQRLFFESRELDRLVPGRGEHGHRRAFLEFSFGERDFAVLDFAGHQFHETECSTWRTVDCRSLNALDPPLPGRLSFVDRMTIYALKSRFQGVLRPLVRLLHRAGVTANQVTVAACVISIGVGILLAQLPRVWFALFPLWMLLRMALNAVDGMLAREFGQKSILGAYLNELTDVISDAALYLPFAFVAPFDLRSAGAVILGSALSEMTGVVAQATGASRRYDGPMGKSDRAFVFSLLAIWIASSSALPAWAVWVMWLVASMILLTIANRIRNGGERLFLHEPSDARVLDGRDQRDAVRPQGQSAPQPRPLPAASREPGTRPDPLSGRDADDRR